MKYMNFECLILDQPSKEYNGFNGDKTGKYNGLFCEIYHSADKKMCNPLSVFNLVAKDGSTHLSDEAAIQMVKDYISKNYNQLMDQAALSMDRFLRINGTVFSFEQVAKALNVQLSKNETVKIDLCQRVNDGVLVAQGSVCDKDDYPGLDVSLELPPEKNSFSVMISRTEQPRLEEEGHPVRTFAYCRSDEYFIYFDADTRSEEEVDRDFYIPRVVVSGGPDHPVEVVSENPYFRYCGELPVNTPKLSLDNQIQSASSRVADSYSPDKAPIKEIISDR